jgi:hypothetical protein
LSFEAVGRAIGISGEQVARICRGQSRNVSIMRVAELLEVVGLELGARAYPGSTPVRDRAQRSLLGRLRARVAPSLSWRLEVPVVDVAGSLDRRAWDACITGADWLIGVDAETHVADWQAVQRRITMKQRDGQVDSVLLLLLESRWHRQVLAGAEDLRGLFPVSARSALRALADGRRPGGSSIVLL